MTVSPASCIGSRTPEEHKGGGAACLSPFIFIGIKTTNNRMRPGGQIRDIQEDNE